MAESEADTPSTPIEFESKYFEFDGVRLPPFCRGKMEDIANFSLRSSDIWIVTYPKSGTSLLQEVVYLVSQGADPDEIGLMNIDEQLPVLEYPQPGLDIIQGEDPAREDGASPALQTASGSPRARISCAGVAHCVSRMSAQPSAFCACAPHVPS
ncbi:sulfotransferase 4A1-like [Salvelinus alpinus]|uniref:sulfotransferase 4A1-like n=1 Tax=Salvelinus alpinus TaxID=8036 RepID=UPI0039FC788C